MFDKKFFTKTAPKIVNMYRKHIFLEGKDIEGKPFKPYKSSYAKAKQSGELPRQATKFANTTSPVLTSDLMRDFTMRKIGHFGFTFGTLVHGGKVLSLAKKGRYLTKGDKVLTDDMDKLLKKEMRKYSKSVWARNVGKSKTVDIKL